MMSRLVAVSVCGLLAMVFGLFMPMLDNLVVNVELVNVQLKATDRQGRLVTDLEKSDLRL